MWPGIPGRVVELTDPDAYLASVDVNGIKRSVSVWLLAAYTDELDAFRPNTGGWRTTRRARSVRANRL